MPLQKIHAGSMGASAFRAINATPDFGGGKGYCQAYSRLAEKSQGRRQTAESQLLFSQNPRPPYSSRRERRRAHKKACGQKDREARKTQISPYSGSAFYSSPPKKTGSKTDLWLLHKITLPACGIFSAPLTSSRKKQLYQWKQKNPRGSIQHPSHQSFLKIFQIPVSHLLYFFHDKAAGLSVFHGRIRGNAKLLRLDRLAAGNHRPMEKPGNFSILAVIHIGRIGAFAACASITAPDFGFPRDPSLERVPSIKIPSILPSFK